MTEMQIDPTPKRLLYGKRNLDLFLTGSPAKPVCYYFEDEGCEELYKRFISKIFPLQQDPLVICTGGKTKDALREVDSLKIGPVIVVHDLDFDDILSDLPTDYRVVTLNRYSFENYLLEIPAILELAIESKRRLKRADAQQKLALSEYFDALHARSRMLSELFVTAQRFRLKGIQTTKLAIENIVGKDTSMPSLESIASFRKKVLAQAQRQQHVATDEDLTAELIKALIPKAKYASQADDHPNSRLCGKHLRDLALIHFDKKLGTSLRNNDEFEVLMRLLTHANVQSFSRVKELIVAAAAKQNVSGVAFS